MEQQYVDDYRFPLPVQDMNNEIIARLDDESLYQLCQTNKQMARTCLSDNIWALRANSPLAPLFIVRDQYKNWMDFYANVRKDYLYYVNVGAGIGRGLVFTNIITAFRRMFAITTPSNDPYKMTLEELRSLVFNTKHRSVSIFITLARKDTVYDQGNVGEYMLYKIGKGDDEFLNPTILEYPNLVDIPVMILVSNSEDGPKIRFVDFSEQALAESRFITGIEDTFYILFGNVNIPMLFIGSVGWIFLRKNFIVNGASFDIEGISPDKYYIVSLPAQKVYQGITFNFKELFKTAYYGRREKIDNLRWYITTFGTFYDLEDILAFLPGGHLANIA